MGNDALIKEIHEGLQPYLGAYGHKSKFLKVNGTAIHSVCCGHGKPVVLLHGFGSFLFTWRKIIKTLARNYEVHSIDLPGFGLSNIPSGFHNGLVNQADFLAQLIESMKIHQVILVGHSFGGAVCIEVCHRHPKLVQAVVLVASCIPGRLSTPAPVMKNLLLFKFFNKSLISKNMIEVTELLNCKKQPDNLTDLLSSTSFDKSKLIKCPALIVWGERDRVIPIETSKEIAQYFKTSKLQTIGNCGHAPHEEKPGEFNDLVLSFLESAGLQPYV